jgi:hypothetical protein
MRKGSETPIAKAQRIEIGWSNYPGLTVVHVGDFLSSTSLIFWERSSILKGSETQTLEAKRAEV